MSENEGNDALGQQLSASHIENLIYTVRGVQVMLDSDLARLYGVETKALNQAVARNPKRFPERYCFQLTKSEADTLRSQIVTLHPDPEKRDSWWRYLPRVFTEQGVAMLSATLRSETAIQVSIRIIDSFAEMRHFIANNAAMFERVREVELRQLEYQRTADDRFEQIFDYMEAHEAPKQKVFFGGQIYDASEMLVELVQRAKREIVLIDGYVDIGTLNILAKKNNGVEAKLLTRPDGHLTEQDIDTFNAQYPHLTVHRTSVFHDRFLILDGTEGFLIGASLKDAGKKTFAIARIEDGRLIRSILAEIG